MKRIGCLWLLVTAGRVFSDPADSAFVDYDLDWIFPQTLGGLKYAAVEKYDNTDLGYSVFYSLDESFDAVVSVYNMGRPAIPDGCRGEGIDLVFDSVQGLLERDQKQGKVSGLKKRGTAVVPKEGELRFLSAVFHYLEGPPSGVQKIEATYVTGLRNNFLKLQFTFDLLEGKKAQPMADQMIEQLITMVQAPADEQNILLASCAAVLCDPAGYGGRTAAQRVLAKAQGMENLNVYTHLFVWPEGYQKPKTADLLIAAYFAGMLPVVVPQQLEEGGEVEAFTAMLKAYQVLRSKEQIVALPEFEKWMQSPDKQALFDQLMLDE
jgi:hypothetical protein